MKAFQLIIIFFILSCASHHDQQLGTFVPEKVCSPVDLSYYNKFGSGSRPSSEKMKALVNKEMLKLQPLVKKCYEAELARPSSRDKYHLCLISGYDKNGKVEYFEFSSEGADLSPDMLQCLRKIRGNIELNLKDVVVLQPFTLRTRGN